MDKSPGKRKGKKQEKNKTPDSIENLSKQGKSSRKPFGEISWHQSGSESKPDPAEKDKSHLHVLKDSEIEVVDLDSSDELEDDGEISLTESSENPDVENITTADEVADENKEDDDLFDSLDNEYTVESNEENEDESNNSSDSEDDNESGNLFDSLENGETQAAKLNDSSPENIDDDQESEDSTEMDILSVSDGEDTELNNLSESNEDENPSSFSRDFSSDQLEDEMESEDATNDEPPPTIPFMRNLQDGVFYRKMDSNSIFVSIVPGECLYFSGKCSVKVLKGVVEIYGCQLTSEEPKRVVFSPKGHSSLLSIISLASESEMDRDITATRSSSIPLLDENEEAAMIILELLETEWCEGIRSYCQDGESLIGPHANGIGTGKLPKLNEFSNKLGFQLISPSLYDKSRLFATSPLWDEVLYNLQLEDHSPRIAIFGGKGVGKSTFFRWTVNKCLSLYGQSVLCIDLDPGQTEFTPPGLISVYLCQEPLLGPNFTHLVQPLRAIFIGSINVSDCPTTYKNAVKSLCDFLQENEAYSNIPWIINTMGFTIGLGLHLACDIIKIFQPTAVIQITIENPKRSFPFELNYKNVTEYHVKNSIGRPSRSQSDSESTKEYQFFTIESVCNARNERNQNPWGGRPKDLRENVIVSYFAQLIGSTTDCSFLSIIPYQVKLEDVAIGTMSSNLSYENILRAINGNLVALCEFPQSSFLSNTTGSENYNRKYILNGSSVMNLCFGYGVVRGMDVQSGLLFVVTPVPLEILTGKVNAIIAAGAIGLPIQFYVNGTNENSELPYISRRGSSKTKLDNAAKKHFNYKRTVPKVVKNSLR